LALAIRAKEQPEIASFLFRFSMNCVLGGIRKRKIPVEKGGRTFSVVNVFYFEGIVMVTVI